MLFLAASSVLFWGTLKRGEMKMLLSKEEGKVRLAPFREKWLGSAPRDFLSNNKQRNLLLIPYT